MYGLQRFLVLCESLCTLLCFPKQPSSTSVCLTEHVAQQSEMFFKCYSGWSHGVPISVTVCESSNTSEITLAKYRSTASSSKLHHSTVSPSTHNGTCKKWASPELGWSERDPSDHMSTRPCHLISPLENGAERKCQQKAMHKQPGLCLELLRQAPLTHPLKIRCSLRERRKQTAKWRFLCSALSKGESLVIILLGSGNLNHEHIINAQFIPAELTQY